MSRARGETGAAEPEGSTPARAEAPAPAAEIPAWSADPDGAVLAGEVAGIVAEVMGDALLGACLHGSAVMGGLHPTSDVDVLAVVAGPTTDAERRAVVDRLLDVSGARARRGPARPVELTIVDAAEVRPWHYPPRGELLYGEWLRDAFERGEVPPPQPMPDLAVLVTMARRGDHPLLGPPPAELLDPVPAADLRRSIVAGIPGLLADLEPDTRNVLLTLARAWLTLATGEIAPKDVAAAWALPRLAEAHRPVLARAREMYLSGVDDDGWGDLRPAARPCADAIVAEIDRLGPAPAETDPQQPGTPPPLRAAGPDGD
jgi:streptomycin 3"-adenylyltransferase